MMDLGYIVIICAFLLYYFIILISEKRLISEPQAIIDKFLSITLLFAGISLIYYSLTGRPFLSDSADAYNVYIFIIGFIAILWTIPHLLKEFKFFRKFMRKTKKKK